MDRDPESERGLDELGAGLDSTCSVGIPECPQDEEVGAERIWGTGLELVKGETGSERR